MQNSKGTGWLAVVTIIIGLIFLFVEIRNGIDWILVTSVCYIVSGLLYFFKATRKWQHPLFLLGMGMWSVYTGILDRTGLQGIISTYGGAILVLGSIILIILTMKGDQPGTNESDNVVSSRTDN